MFFLPQWKKDTLLACGRQIESRSQEKNDNTTLGVKRSLHGREVLTVVGELDYRIHMLTFWIASMVVLHWIHQPSNKYRDCVAHRIAHIGEDLKRLEACGERRIQVKYVPTNVNVADAGTRGLELSKMRSESTWLCSPEFLHQPEDSWPRRPDEREVIEEEQELRKQVHTRSTAVEESMQAIFNLNRHLSFERAKRVVANVLKFISLIMSGKVNSKKGESSQSYRTNELHRAELILLRHTQRESFARELQNLTDSKLIAKNSPLVKLSPFIDESDGLLRVGGPTTRRPNCANTRRPNCV